MMHLCQFGQNLASGSEDRVQTRLFHGNMTMVTLKIRSMSLKLIIPFGCPKEVSVQVWLKSILWFIC